MTVNKKSSPKSSSRWKLLIADKRFMGGMFFLGLMIFLALIGPLFFSEQVDTVDLSKRLAPPSWENPLGRDVNGEDVLKSIIYGARISLYVGFITVFLCLTFGLLIGLVSGYWGGLLDIVMMRIVDILLAFPGILVAMILASLLGPSINNVILSITATGWISSARLVRGQVLSLKKREFVLGSIAVGGSRSRTIFYYILPEVIPSLIIHGTFSLSSVIIIESSLSFLGLGPQGSITSWGGLLSQGKSVLQTAPHLSIAPGLAILITVMSLNFMGDSLRDMWDPKEQTKKLS